MCGPELEPGHSCIDIESLITLLNDQAAARMAELLATTPDTTRASFGSAWSLMPEVSFPDLLPDGSANRYVWFESGAPVEALLALPTAVDGDASVFVPRLSWHGPGDLVLTAGPLVASGPVDDDLYRWLPGAIDEARRRRRRTFRRCSRCGEPAPPEEREGDTCHECMELDGVVF